MAMLANLRREERIGLGVAALLHAALVLVFLMQPERRETSEPAQRVAVNLTSEVGLEAVAPEIVAESRAAVAPALAEMPAPTDDAAIEPRPQPTIQPRVADNTRTNESRAPASAIGASERASLLQGVVRQVKPHWQPPSGPDVDQLVSRIRFRLNPDGSLAGRPVLVSQRGETDANRAQAGRHGEQAIRAVQLAAPFDLPERYYDAWKTVTLDFDWKLSQ
jgi:periplasmic protein TonB